ncbi:hypothetical protein AJ79_05212 [Helicocarpus griseus UAMH5409]|uniref:Gamma interferon inducible lysosomal thiol reductase n=1 Tax=Helicocarpus griseus UAMH5409 TaxID=1447875 RepID=A0A2B7XQC7_9EURO|nr:hypothetical protein AJ79_05212 [Helicocarpus griseus UAMH5409]
MEKQQMTGELGAPYHPRRDRNVLRLVRRSFLAICLCLLIFAVVHKPHLPYSPLYDLRQGKTSAPCCGGNDDSAIPLMGNNDNNAPAATADSNRVPLEAHIMSKCPDAQYCLERLIVPSMVQVHEKVDFRLSFIGSASNDSSAVSCMHGPGECVGDMILLCAANLPYSPDSKTYPKTPTVRSLGFANCLISSYEKIPQRELVEDCALEHGIDFKALNACASRQLDENDDEHAGVEDPNKLSGLALLRKDFHRTARLGIKTSCTVRVDEKIWCVRDGGEWTDCEKDGGNVTVLSNEIERLYKSKN